MTDWPEIEHAWRTSGASTRRLARRYGVAESTLRHRARVGGWVREQRPLTLHVITSEAATAHLTPLEYLLAVMRDENAPMDRRMDAAIMAAPYCHAKASGN